MPITDPEISAISDRLKGRIIEVYEVISAAFKPDQEYVSVTLSPGQCATILSLVSSGYKSAFGEKMPNAPEVD